MRPTHWQTWLRRGSATALLLAGSALLGGCLGEPKIEDKWTRIDLVGASVRPNQLLPAASAQVINVKTRITYRSILTGFAVVELRKSSSITTGGVVVDPDASREPMAYDIDRILANSVTLGRATRAVTGWDHLQQELDLTFTGATPASGDTSAAGLFLLCYMGAGDEVERQDGSDTLIVTPFISSQVHLLPIGMELAVASPLNN
jgi:hypothetical protein